MENGVQALAVCVAKSRHLPLSPSFQRCSFSSWIKDNIKKKECYFYVEDDRYTSANMQPYFDVVCSAESSLKVLKKYMYLGG